MDEANTPAQPLAIRIDTPNLYLRTLTVNDASPQWLAWFGQTDIRDGLNLADAPASLAEVAAYIGKYDQRSNIILGIFDRTNDLLLGILATQVDWDKARYLANTFVGETAYRNRGVMLEVAAPFRDYFFDTLNLKVMTATALATNEPIISYLRKTGWTLNRTLKNHTRSHKDGTMVDLHLYSITREAWHAWKAANPELLAAMRQGAMRES
ncbi:MAG: GNAT family N-acetyltransferase [Micropepsaceae bacterium]